jgi:predicted O-linked N-acetylglucosamine transferase (SPINDLY family)
MRSFVRTRRMCEWDDFSARQVFARARLADGAAAAMPPFVLLSEPGVTAGEQQQCSEAWMRDRLAGVAEERARLAFAFSRSARAKIRLAYLSNDFQEHATALLLIETLEAHDRSLFEVHLYSYGADDGGALRKRIVGAVDRFTDIGPLSDSAAARAIHADGIDILIDLKGYTQNSRTSILAFRPAPIQVNYLGYPGTLGPELCDYIITDAFVTPAASAENYSECFAELPNSYQPRGRGREIGPAPSRASVGLPEAGFVFCCFNQAFKFTPDVFDVWCRLLDSVPGSVLWLLASREAEGNLRNEALQRGIGAHRLVFAPDAGQDDHLARLQLADLVLDTAPYGAHTTASDALWAGVPMVTRPGPTFPSRVAGSLLHAVGLPELIVEDEDDYFGLAFALAADPDQLELVRRKLAGKHHDAPLFDVLTYTGHLEGLFRAMWGRYELGLPCAAIRQPG